MPKLNLDIFSDADDTPSKKAKNGPATPSTGDAEPAPANEDHATQDKDPSTTAATEKPKFVPVGFYPRHLRALDDAVLELRRRGHWKASKSAIIRGLIEAHEDELQQFYQP